MSMETLRALAVIGGWYMLYVGLIWVFALAMLAAGDWADRRKRARVIQANAEERIASARAWRHVPPAGRQQHAEWLSRVRRAG